MTKTKLDHKIEARCTKFEKSKLKFLAKKYANKNLSLFVIASAMLIEEFMHESWIRQNIEDYLKGKK